MPSWVQTVAEKARCSSVLAGREDYEVEADEVTFLGKDLLGSCSRSAKPRGAFLGISISS